MGPSNILSTTRNTTLTTEVDTCRLITAKSFQRFNKWNHYWPHSYDVKDKHCSKTYMGLINIMCGIQHSRVHLTDERVVQARPPDNSKITLNVMVKDKAQM